MFAFYLIFCNVRLSVSFFLKYFSIKVSFYLCRCSHLGYSLFTEFVFLLKHKLFFYEEVRTFAKNFFLQIIMLLKIFPCFKTVISLIYSILNHNWYSTSSLFVSRQITFIYGLVSPLKKSILLRFIRRFVLG